MGPRCGSGFWADCRVVERAIKYLLRFLFALVISAIVVITYASIQAVGNEHSRLGRVENMTSQGSNNNNKVKQDGFLLEIREPRIIALAIPENKPGATSLNRL